MSAPRSGQQRARFRAWALAGVVAAGAHGCHQSQQRLLDFEGEARTACSDVAAGCGDAMGTIDDAGRGMQLEPRQQVPGTDAGRLADAGDAGSPLQDSGLALVGEDAGYDPCPPVFAGSVQIETEADFAQLSCARTIDGDLVVANTALTSLAGLERIVRVNGTLRIEGNPDLLTLAGLSKLNSAGSVVIADNSVIADLSGLAALRTVVDGLEVARNGMLTSLAGLSLLSSVQTLTLRENPALQSLAGMPSLDLLVRLVVEDCDALTTIAGLPEAARVYGLRLVGNEQITTLDGFQLTAAGDITVWLADNPQLADVDTLQSLVGANVVVLRNNPSITNLDALANLFFIEGLSSSRACRTSSPSTSTT